MSLLRRRAALSTAVLLAGMASAAVQPALGQDVTEVTVWFGRENFIPADRFESFNEANPDINVTTDVIPLEQSVADTIRAAQANRAPTIVQTPADGLAPLVAQGAVQPIDDLLEQWEQDDPESFNDLSQTAWDMASLDGQTYGVTLFAGPFWYTYRSDWLEEAGMDVPQTWDDVLEFARAMRDQDRIGFSTIGSRAHDPVWFLSMFMAMGGQFEDGAPQLDSEAGHYLLSFYQTLVREDLTSQDVLAWDSGAMRAAFINGEAAQAMIGDNVYPTINETLTWNVEWDGSAPPVRPGAEDEGRTMTLGWPFLVTEGAENREAVLKVLQYLAEAENVAEVSMRYQPGTVLSVFGSDQYNEVKPWSSKFSEAFANLTPLPTHPRQSQIYQILLDAMQMALQNPDQDAAEIAAQHQAEIDALVQE
jgi:ABC-type glycerol-3-phosphate transport system substrate-binding protein